MQNTINRPMSIEALGKPIWENIYIVRMRYIDTLSTEMIKIRGVPTVQDAGLDRSMHTQPITCGITIDAMVEHFKRGVRIAFVNNDDAMRVYNIVNEYLLAWQHEFDTSLNTGGAPHEDLLTLDRFAVALYPQAAMFGTIKPRTNLVGSMFEKNGHIGRNSLFGAKIEERTVIRKEHNSFAKDIAKNMSDNPAAYANKTSGRNGWK